MKRRVVITGLGVLSPVGTGHTQFWKNVQAGRSGIEPIQAFPIQRCSVHAVGEVKGFDPQAYVKNRKALKVMARDIQLAVAAAKLAIEDSALDLIREDPLRCGTSFGASIINNELDELGVAFRQSLDDQGKVSLERFGAEGMSYLFPLWLLKYLPNMLACHISITYNLQGPSNSITTACASSTQAIGEGFRIIERGQADVMVCGGGDSKVNPIGMMRYKLLGLLSMQKQNGVRSCRPFDKRRDGLVVGEGAGVLILEGLEHAKKRGATIYAEVVGFGASGFFDFNLDREKSARARVLAMQLALKDAQVLCDQIDYISASGNSVVLDDYLETQAIKTVFGKQAHRVPVSAMKSIIGHLAAACGAVELIATCLALRDGVIPPTLNYEEPDPECDLDYVPNQARKAEIKRVLLNSFGIGGQTASVVVKKFED